MTSLTRRALLRKGLMAGSAVAGAKLLSARPAGAQIPPWPSGLPPALVGSGRVYPDLLPSGHQLLSDVRHMVDLGPRFTGTPAHDRWIDWIEEGLIDAGCRMLPRDRFPFQQWLAEDWSLELLDGSTPRQVPVSGYASYSGQTPPGGVTGALAYLGTVPDAGLSGDVEDVANLEASLERLGKDIKGWTKAALAGIPGGADGRIVLVDTQSPPPLAIQAFAPLMTYRYAPGDPLTNTEDYKRMWVASAILPHVLSALQEAGAAGGVLILDGSAANAAGQYVPYGLSLVGLPALLVDRATGDALRQQAQTTPTARLTLTASLKKVVGTQLVGLLAGDPSNDEVVILNTHTDGMNAFEENGGIGLVRLARYFSQLPPKARLKRTLVFSAVMGHFSPVAGTAQTTGFVQNHPDVISRAAASLTLEHFGTSEWIDDARGYHPTGRPEPLGLWHSQTPIAAPLVDSMVANKLDQGTALRPAGTYMIAVGGPLHTAGVPSVSFIAGPNYLVSWADNGHIDKFRPKRAEREMRWAADFVTRLDGIPSRQLSAGDTTALAQTRGTPLAGNGVY